MVALLQFGKEMGLFLNVQKNIYKSIITEKIFLKKNKKNALKETG